MKKQRLMTQIESTTYQKLRALAFKLQVSISEVVRRAIEKYLNE